MLAYSNRVRFGSSSDGPERFGHALTVQKTSAKVYLRLSTVLVWVRPDAKMIRNKIVDMCLLVWL